MSTSIPNIFNPHQDSGISKNPRAETLKPKASIAHAFFLLTLTTAFVLHYRQFESTDTDL